jgi:hypothetical protein
MTKGSYIGAHTKIFLSDGGTKWEVADSPANRPNDSRRDRWHGETLSEPDGGLRKVSKEERSFVSMCAVAFRSDALTDTNPKPRHGLQKEIKLAGENKRWIAGNPIRLSIFEAFFRKSSKA